VPVVFPLRIGGVFHVKSCVSAVIDFVLLHIPYVVDNISYLIRSVSMGFHQSFIGINYADVTPY
jgi:hypothetical protein